MSSKPETFSYRFLVNAALNSVLVLSGCAGVDPPKKQIAQSDFAIREAEEVGARNSAPLELRNAQKTQKSAERAMEEKNYQEAAELAEQAKVQAELAKAITQSHKSRQSAKELKESIETLKQEIHRSGKPFLGN